MRVYFMKYCRIINSEEGDKYCIYNMYDVKHKTSYRVINIYVRDEVLFITLLTFIKSVELIHFSRQIFSRIVNGKMNII